MAGRSAQRRSAIRRWRSRVAAGLVRTGHSAPLRSTTRGCAPRGFVGSSGPIGNVVRSSPWGGTIDVVFKARAHAGLAPEEGRSAIVAAAQAISDLRLGRIDEETTANVGRITGGTARNVVPERCELAVEARSRDQEAGRSRPGDDRLLLVRGGVRCEVETTIGETYPGYRFQRQTSLSSSSPFRRWSGPGSPRRRWTRAAAQMPTSSMPAASRASSSRTA